MLPSYLRLDLRSLPDFFSTAKTKKGDHFLLRFQAASTVPLSSTPTTDVLLLTRLAIVVPKRFGDASQRVKIKRWARQAIIELSQQQSSLFTDPYSVVFILNRPVKSYQAVYQDIENLLSQLA